jgi:di/tricarboxylate transporter
VQIRNTATDLIIIPITIAASHNIGVSLRPVLMSVAVVAAAFLTPIATPAKLMVMSQQTTNLAIIENSPCP